MGLEADDDIILWPEFRRIVGRANLMGRPFAVLDQCKAVVAHCLQMRAARHQRQVDIGGRQLGANVTADRTRPVNADLGHDSPSFSDSPMR